MSLQHQINTKPKTQFELSKAIIDNLYKFNLNHTTSLVLVKLANHYPQMFPSQETIAKTLGMSRASVNYAIKDLKNKNLIAYKTKRYNIYHFTENLFETINIESVKVFDTKNFDTDNLTPDKSKYLTQDVKKIDTICKEFRHKQISNKENNKKNNNSSFKNFSYEDGYGKLEDGYIPKGGFFTPVAAIPSVQIPDEYKSKKPQSNKQYRQEKADCNKMSEEQREMGLYYIKKLKENFLAERKAKGYDA